MAGRRLQITHRTGYRYADIVDASFNEVRMTPLSVDGQVLLNHHLDVRPAAAVQGYVDYWGAHVQAFDVHVPHRVLEVIATSTVDTPPLPAYRPGTTWDVVTSDTVQDELSEYLTATTYVDLPTDGERAAAVAEMRAAPTPGPSPVGVPRSRSSTVRRS